MMIYHHIWVGGGGELLELEGKNDYNTPIWLQNSISEDLKFTENFSGGDVPESPPSQGTAGP